MLLRAATAVGTTHNHTASSAAATSVNWCGDFRDSRALRQKLGAPQGGFATCALVGSSGVLALERLGERIDAAEFVMRFNLNQVGGFEPIVGSITTLRLLDTEAIGDMIAERREEIRQGGARLRRFRNASWCPAYSVYLNTPNKLHRDTFAAMCSRATKIIDASVFDEHTAVLDALDPHGTNLMSGQFGVALTTMLCPNGVNVYGITHSGSVSFSQRSASRSILQPPVLHRYYDEANHAESEAMESLDESASLLSELAAAQPECIRLWTTMGENVAPHFKPDGDAPGAAPLVRGDDFIDAIVRRRNTSAWKAKQAVRKAWGRTPADQFAEEVCAYDEYGPAIESLEVLPTEPAADLTLTPTPTLTLTPTLPLTLKPESQP